MDPAPQEEPPQNEMTRNKPRDAQLRQQKWGKCTTSIRIRRMQTALSVLLLAVMAVLIVQVVTKAERKCGANSRHPDCPHPLTCSDAPQPFETPRPLVVISAGASRASSTLLYNALRILLRLRDPNTVAGWYADLQHMYDNYAQPMDRNGTVASTDGRSRVDAFRALGSVLIKIHTVRDWHTFLGGGDVEPVLEDVVDAVFVTHRDLRESVRSIRDMGWGRRTTDAELAHADFCRKKPRHERKDYLMAADFEQESTWVNVARTQLRCRQVMLRAAGSKLRMDLRAEDMQGAKEGDFVALLRQLSEHLEFEYSDEMLRLAARELAQLRPVRCDSGFDMEMSVNPVTHMHKAHVHRAAPSEHAVRGAAAIVADEECGAWLRHHSYL